MSSEHSTVQMDILKRFALFSGCNEQTLKDIQKRLVVKTYERTALPLLLYQPFSSYLISILIPSGPPALAPSPSSPHPFPCPLALALAPRRFLGTLLPFPYVFFQ